MERLQYGAASGDRHNSFGKYARGWNTVEEVIANFGAPDPIHDPYFDYIANKMRLGNNDY